MQRLLLIAIAVLSADVAVQHTEAKFSWRFWRRQKKTHTDLPSDDIVDKALQHPEARMQVFLHLLKHHPEALNAYYRGDLETMKQPRHRAAYEAAGRRALKLQRQRKGNGILYRMKRFFGQFPELPARPSRFVGPQDQESMVKVNYIAASLRHCLGSRARAKLMVQAPELVHDYPEAIVEYFEWFGKVSSNMPNVQAVATVDERCWEASLMGLNVRRAVDEGTAPKKKPCSGPCTMMWVRSEEDVVVPEYGTRIPAGFLHAFAPRGFRDVLLPGPFQIAALDHDDYRVRAMKEFRWFVAQGDADMAAMCIVTPDRPLTHLTGMYCPCHAEFQDRRTKLWSPMAEPAVARNIKGAGKRTSH